MPARKFEAAVRRRPGVAVVDLHGDINLAAEEVLNAAYIEAEAQAPDAIVLNFAGVEYMNSTGIALIVGLLARCRSAQRRLLACGLSDHYREIFAITRLADYMAVFSDETAALAELAGNAPSKWQA